MLSVFHQYEEESCFIRSHRYTRVKRQFSVLSFNNNNCNFKPCMVEMFSLTLILIID